MIKLRTLLLSNKLFNILFLVITIYALFHTSVIKYNSLYYGTETCIKAIIIAYKIDGNKLSLELKGKEKLVANYYFESKEEKESYIYNYDIGDEILINGELIKPDNNTIPNLFNYKKYLYNNKIFYILNIESFSLSNKNKNILLKIKNYFYKRIYFMKNNEYIYTFVLGEKSYVNSKVNNTYRINGITHLFSLSGLHVSIFSLIIMFVLKLFKLKDIYKYSIVFFVLLLLCFITGFLPSIVRASLLFFLLGINKAYYFYIKTDNVLLVVYFILVLINPFIIFDLGFQLSFTITYFLIISSYLMKDKKYITSLLIVSIISFISSFPLVANNFYEFNILSIINNLFFVPFISFIVYPLSLITFIFPCFNFIFQFFINILEFVSLYLGKINILIISFPKVDLFFILTFYILLIIIIKNKQFKLSLCIFILCIFYYIKPYFDNNSYVCFIDVKTGDSALIISPHRKKTVVIDTGGKADYYSEEWSNKNNNYSLGNNLILFYKSMGIKKIDYMFITHGDADHCKEAPIINDNMKVSNIFINRGNVNTLENNIDNYKIFDKNYLNIDNMKITSLNKLVYNDENSNSLVFHIIIDKVKVLLMGDATKQVEKNIMKEYSINNVDILKVGHHGSNTSSDKSFINIVNPNYSIISVGRNNKYGHPTKEVLDTLKNTKIYRTDKSGTICFIIKDNIMNIMENKP